MRRREPGHNEAGHGDNLEEGGDTRSNVKRVPSAYGVPADDKSRLGCAGQRRIELKPGSELRAAEAAEI